MYNLFAYYVFLSGILNVYEVQGLVVVKKTNPGKKPSRPHLGLMTAYAAAFSPRHFSDIQQYFP